MKASTIILISILVLVIVGGVLYFVYNQDNDVNQGDDSGLDRIESAINDKLNSKDSVPLTGMDKIEQAINEKLDK
jgi:uncharacterized protein YpmB